MKKLLILLAALSLVACSSNKPKEQMMETPMTAEVMVDDKVMEVAAMAEEKAMKEAAMAKEKAMEVAAMAEKEAMEAAEAMAKEEAMKAAAKTYTVLDGDNLFQIGLKYNMSWDKLTEMNDISNPDVISVGQILTMPTE